MNWFVVLLGTILAAGAADISELIADRAAIERVYYNHRTGDKPPFEETLSPVDLRKLVERDLDREEALRNVYGVTISDTDVQTEVNRINRTTRDPAALGEIKAALGGDESRFARAVARPIVVERMLRSRFENDSALHATQRSKAETLRSALLTARDGKKGIEAQRDLLRHHAAKQVLETTWRLTSQTSGEDAAKRENTRDFNDLPSALRKVLGAQLRATGDVSAVIETDTDFCVFLSIAKNEKQLKTASVSFPKLPLDPWVSSVTQDSKHTIP